MTNKTLTLGSLFDGSGGFPLGGLLAGITPVWASEIEPFPIRVTTKRLPFMKHYGNISAMDGGRIEPVDIITFGSPCQDMSVAGRRDGLDGKRSSLFYEAVRIIKEMRCATDGRYPRYIVWENVPGAFSSNKGEDFKAVLEAVIGIAEPNAEVPMPEKARWPYADLYMGDGWSVAYRTLDAQYWGVPQRRRRIYLVADLAGGSAGKILFESEGLSGYSAEGFRSWQRAAGSFTPCAGATGFEGYNGSLTDDTSATLGVNCGMSTDRNGIVLNDQGGDRMNVSEDVAATLRAEAHHPPCVMESAGFCTEHSAKSRTIGYEEECSPTLRTGVVPAAVSLENHPTDSRVKLSEDGNVQTLTSRMGTGGNNVPLVMKIRSGCEGGGKGALIQENKSATLSCNNDQTLFEPCGWDGGQVSPTLTKQNAGGNQRMPDKDNFTCVLQPFGISFKDSNAMKSDNPHSGIYEAETARTLDGNGGTPSCNQGGIAVVAFTQNQRDEVRDLGDRSAVVCANAGTKQQTFVLQGSMIGREDKNGPQGDGINEDVSFTLNTVDHLSGCPDK
jgi:DNA (cytosine-5)-methyltransferase 1